MVNVIGETIARLRKNKGLTQKELADQLYVSNKTISKWENGTSLPDIQATIDIAKCFDITVDELLTGEGVIDTSASENDLVKYKILIFINIFTIAISFLFLLFKLQAITMIVASIVGLLFSIIAKFVSTDDQQSFSNQSYILMNYIHAAFYITHIVILICTFNLIY